MCEKVGSQPLEFITKNSMKCVSVFSAFSFFLYRRGQFFWTRFRNLVYMAAGSGDARPAALMIMMMIIYLYRGNHSV